jgi:SPP1 gp7 family putative phage head morphogenesis protein
MAFHKTKTAENQYKEAIQNAILKPLQKNLIINLNKAVDLAEGWESAIDRTFKDADYNSYVDDAADVLANTSIDQLAAWHKKKLATQFEKLFSVDVKPFLNERATQAALQPIINANISLIKSIPVELHNQIETQFNKIVYTQGFDQQAMAKMIGDRFSVSHSRAKLIASDQTSKTIGALTMIRHGQAGVNYFEWSSSEDEKVRPEHRRLNGKVFAWDSPPDEGIPGQPINCRCVALPVFEPPISQSA